MITPLETRFATTTPLPAAARAAVARRCGFGARCGAGSGGGCIRPGVGAAARMPSAASRRGSAMVLNRCPSAVESASASPMISRDATRLRDSARGGFDPGVGFGARRGAGSGGGCVEGATGGSGGGPSVIGLGSIPRVPVASRGGVPTRSGAAIRLPSGVVPKQDVRRRVDGDGTQCTPGGGAKRCAVARKGLLATPAVGSRSASRAVSSSTSPE